MRRVVSKITEVLEFLGDGKWHGLDELKAKMRLTAFQVHEIITFLGE